MDWIYSSSGKKPDEGEEVLVDFGMAKGFKVMIYENGYFVNPQKENDYAYTEVKRWCHLGKHYNQEF